MQAFGLKNSTEIIQREELPALTFKLFYHCIISSDKELIKSYFLRHRARYLPSLKETHLTTSPKSKVGKEEVIPHTLLSIPFSRAT